MTKKVLVVGGAGFIGSHIVTELVKRGYDVHVLDNLSGGKREKVDPKATLHVLDICDLEAIKPVFTGVDTVFHLAALPRVQYSIEHPVETNGVNVSGTVNVLTAAKEAGVRRVVYSASSSAYGDQEVLPLVETMDARPKSPYGLQKYIGELYAKVFSEVYGLGTVSLRYFNVYGFNSVAAGETARHEIPTQGETRCFSWFTIPTLTQRRLPNQARKCLPRWDNSSARPFRPGLLW